MRKQGKIDEFECIFFDYDWEEQKVIKRGKSTAVQIFMKINNPIVILDDRLTREKLEENLNFNEYIHLRKGVGYKGTVHRLVFRGKEGDWYIFSTMKREGRRLVENKKNFLKVSEHSLKYIYPLVLSPDLKEEGFIWSGNYIIFPYEYGSKQPVSKETLRSESPELYNYFRSRERALMQQSRYNQRIQKTNEVYGLIRVGDYTYANWYVCIRDNTKPNPCLVGKIMTHWGEEKMPIFDNHISYLSFDDKDRSMQVYKKLKELEPLFMAFYDERSIGARLPFRL